MGDGQMYDPRVDVRTNALLVDACVVDGCMYVCQMDEYMHQRWMHTWMTSVWRMYTCVHVCVCVCVCACINNGWMRGRCMEDECPMLDGCILYGYTFIVMDRYKRGMGEYIDGWMDG